MHRRNHYPCAEITEDSLVSNSAAAGPDGRRATVEVRVVYRDGGCPVGGTDPNLGSSVTQKRFAIWDVID